MIRIPKPIHENEIGNKSLHLNRNPKHISTAFPFFNSKCSFHFSMEIKSSKISLQIGLFRKRYFQKINSFSSPPTARAMYISNCDLEIHCLKILRSKLWSIWHFKIWILLKWVQVGIENRHPMFIRKWKFQFPCPIPSHVVHVHLRLYSFTVALSCPVHCYVRQMSLGNHSIQYIEGLFKSLCCNILMSQCTCFSSSLLSLHLAKHYHIQVYLWFYGLFKVTVECINTLSFKSDRTRKNDRCRMVDSQ